MLELHRLAFSSQPDQVVALVEDLRKSPPVYYSRFGFSPAISLGFRRPSLRVPPGGFQVCLLSAFEPWMTGTLVYRRAF